MGILSLWQWVLALVLVFGFVVPALLAAWMIRRRPDARTASALMSRERADEPARPTGILRDLA